MWWTSSMMENESWKFGNFFYGRKRKLANLVCRPAKWSFFRITYFRNFWICNDTLTGLQRLRWSISQETFLWPARAHRRTLRCWLEPNWILIGSWLDFVCFVRTVSSWATVALNFRVWSSNGKVVRASLPLSVRICQKENYKANLAKNQITDSKLVWWNIRKLFVNSLRILFCVW